MENKWMKLHHIFDHEMGLDTYLDCEPSEDDILFLSRLIEKAPNSIKNLRGFPLSKQLKIKDLFEKFKDDPMIAISILENHSIDQINLEDEMDLVLLELSVRKESSNDPKDKVNSILGLSQTIYDIKMDPID